MNTRKENGGVTPLILSLGTKRKWVVIFKPRTHPSSPGKGHRYPGMYVSESRQISGLAGFRSSDRPDPIRITLINMSSRPSQIPGSFLKLRRGCFLLHPIPGSYVLVRETLVFVRTVSLIYGVSSIYSTAPNKRNYVYHTICPRIRPSYFNKCSTGMGKSENLFCERILKDNSRREY